MTAHPPAPGALAHARAGLPAPGPASRLARDDARPPPPPADSSPPPHPSGPARGTTAPTTAPSPSTRSPRPARPRPARSARSAPGAARRSARSTAAAGHRAARASPRSLLPSPTTARSRLHVDHGPVRLDQLVPHLDQQVECDAGLFRRRHHAVQLDRLTAQERADRFPRILLHLRDLAQRTLQRVRERGALTRRQPVQRPRRRVRANAPTDPDRARSPDVHSHRLTPSHPDACLAPTPAARQPARRADTSTGP